MIEKIQKDLQPYIDQFVGRLETEHAKVIQMQENVDRYKQECLKHEENRLVEHRQLKSNLYQTEEKYKEFQNRLKIKEKELNTAISNYREKESEYERKTKEAARNVAETKSLKELNGTQLEKNRKIEENYRKKLDFLKQDDNRLNKRQNEINARNTKLDAIEKMCNKKEYENAKVKLALDERAEMIKIEEKRQQIDRANMEKSG